MSSNQQQSSISFPPSPLIWFVLVDSATGEPYKGTSASSVIRNSLVVSVIDQFRDAVQLKYDKPNYLNDIPSGALLVYKNKAAFDKRNAAVDEGNEEPLKSSLSLDGLGTTEEEALVVVVPSVNEAPPATSSIDSTGVVGSGAGTGQSGSSITDSFLDSLSFFTIFFPGYTTTQKPLSSFPCPPPLKSSQFLNPVRDGAIRLVKSL